MKKFSVLARRRLVRKIALAKGYEKLWLIKELRERDALRKERGDN